MSNNTSFYVRAGIVAILACLAITLATCALGASLAQAQGAPHAVALTDARYAPPFLARLMPGTAVDVRHQCKRGTYFTEYQAYRHDGSALSAQRWAGETLVYWPGRHGRVTFDGLTFRNETRATVLVAGWCG